MQTHAPILLADDDLVYARLLHSAIAKVAPSAPFFHVDDGEKAIQFLEGTGRYSDREKSPMPRLLLLDLNMPAKDGFEVLEWIKTRACLRNLPVVVISGSQDADTVARARELGAWAFFAKPNDLAGFQQLARSLESCLDTDRVPGSTEDVAALQGCASA